MSKQYNELPHPLAEEANAAYYFEKQCAEALTTAANKYAHSLMSFEDAQSVRWHFARWDRARVRREEAEAARKLAGVS